MASAACGPRRMTAGVICRPANSSLNWASLTGPGLRCPGAGHLGLQPEDIVQAAAALPLFLTSDGLEPREYKIILRCYKHTTRLVDAHMFFTVLEGLGNTPPPPDRLVPPNLEIRGGAACVLIATGLGGMARWVATHHPDAIRAPRRRPDEEPSASTPLPRRPGQPVRTARAQYRPARRRHPLPGQDPAAGTPFRCRP